MRRRIRAAALPIRRHSLPQIVVDGALIALAYLLGFQLRFDAGPHEPYALLRDRTLPWVVLGGIVVLVLSRVYQRRWRYSSQRDYYALARGVVAIALLTALGIAVLHPVVAISGGHGQRVGINLPNGVAVLFLLLCLAFLLGVRVLARALHERRPLTALRFARRPARSVLIVGAGDGGRLVLREIARNRQLGLVPVGFLDDDASKHRLRIDGVKVRGDTDGDLPRILDEAEPDEVIIAIPSAPGSTRARVVRECRARSIPVRTLPTVFELLQNSGSVTLARQVREVRVEDVLGREPVRMELAAAASYLTGEVVLVTGAGGSIGAELCRQIVQVHPSKVLLLDHAEDNLFGIVRELEEERHVPSTMLEAMLADCRREADMRAIFATRRPSVVFHAAAYKHVGLMEGNPIEAVRNNALASRLVATLAGEHGAERFVLVSTDKAVSPATVMGASKALAELSLELASARHPHTRYAAVRFGNVLGSSGSVVPIFQRQIERGGPVTVTDERMERYFMTIPEAVQLIIRSGALVGLAGAAELFVLDMGEPVKIVELARAMIELSGLRPGQDIPIELVGRRPGEKLTEQLFASHEHALPTESEKIVRVARKRLGSEPIESVFAEIEALLQAGDGAALAARLPAVAVSAWSGRQAQPAPPLPRQDGASGPLEGQASALPRSVAAKPRQDGEAQPLQAAQAESDDAPSPEHLTPATVRLRHT